MMGLVAACGGAGGNNRDPYSNVSVLFSIAGNPSSDATDVDLGTSVTATFEDVMDQITISTASLKLADPNGDVTGEVSYDNKTKVATFTPSSRLAFLTKYTVTLVVGIKDKDGNESEEDFTWSFTTRDRKWGTPQLVEMEENVGSYAADVAINARGDAFAVWTTEAYSSQYDVWANNYTIEKGWGTPELIGAGEGSEASWSLEVVMDSKGNAMAAWYSEHGTHSIWLNKFTVGKGWGTAEEIVPYVSCEYYHDEKVPISMNADGYAMLAWSLYDEDVYAMRYSPVDGWGTAQIVNDNDYSVNSFPDVAVSESGNAVVVWAQSDLSYPRVWSNYYTIGKGWDSKAKVIIDPCNRPQAAMDAKGDAVAVCQSYSGIWANHYNSGDDWGRQQLITDFPSSGDKINVAMSANGNAMVLWGNRDVWASYYTAAENEWLTPKIIEEGGGLYYPLSLPIAADMYGNFIIGWDHDDEYGSYHIRASRVAAEGKWEPLVFGVDDSIATTAESEIAMNGGGDAIVVWSQSEKDYHNHIWANLYQ